MKDWMKMEQIIAGGELQIDWNWQIFIIIILRHHLTMLIFIDFNRLQWNQVNRSTEGTTSTWKCRTKPSSCPKFEATSVWRRPRREEISKSSVVSLLSVVCMDYRSIAKINPNTSGAVISFSLVANHRQASVSSPLIGQTRWERFRGRVESIQIDWDSKLTFSKHHIWCAKFLSSRPPR